MQQAVLVGSLASAVGFGLVVGVVAGLAFVRALDCVIDRAFALAAFLWTLMRR